MARTIAKDHDAKRAQILATAAAIFAREGFDRTSMSQIAAACGVSKANIYHYCESKEALLFNLLDGFLRALRDSVLAADDPTLPPETRFRRAVTAVMAAYQGAEDHHRLQVAGLGPLGEAKREALRGYQRDLVAHVSAILFEIAPGPMADPDRRRATTMSVFAMLNWHFMWNTRPGPAAREAYATLVADLTLGGIRDEGAASVGRSGDAPP